MKQDKPAVKKEKRAVIEFKKFDGRCNKLVGDMFASERCMESASHKIVFSDGSYGYVCNMHIPQKGWKSPWRDACFVEAVAI
jgi:hypothetical protein